MIVYGNNVKGYGVSKARQPDPQPKKARKTAGDGGAGPGRAVTVDGIPYMTVRAAAAELGVCEKHLSRVLRLNGGRGRCKGRAVAYADVGGGNGDDRR